MTSPLHPLLAAHLERHARKLYRIACGFGRERDADDLIQTLYTRWWRRMTEEPGWTPPESSAELFVCVRRAVIDNVAKEQRQRAHLVHVDDPSPWGASVEESLFAFERLEWILAHLPDGLADALKASLAAGRDDDATVARELGLTTGTFTARLFKARRAAEELASFYELLPLELAELAATLRFSGKSRSRVAEERGLALSEVSARWQEALELLGVRGRVAS